MRTSRGSVKFWLVAYVRAVRTASGAVAVQVVWKSSRGSRDIEHLGSAHTEAEVEVLKAVAAQRIAAGQDQLPLDVAAPQEPMALEIVSSRMGRLLDAIAAVYRQLGFEKACGRDVVFEQLVTARIIEPTSKQDASRVLAEAGVRALSYRTVKRRLPGYAKPEWRNRLSGACAAAAQLGPSALVLYDVTTLWFETDTGDGFREPGFSKERRLDPQITVGLLTDATGMPLMIDAFEGNRAETKTIIPLVQRFVAAHGIAGVTVIAQPSGSSVCLGWPRACCWRCRSRAASVCCTGPSAPASRCCSSIPGGRCSPSSKPLCW